MLFLLALLPFAHGALPTDGANVYYCPKGYCLGPKKQMGGFAGPATSFVECQSSKGSVNVEVYNPFMDRNSGLMGQQPWNFVYDPKAAYLPKDVNGAALATQCCTGHTETQCTTHDGQGKTGGDTGGGEGKCPKVQPGMVGICISDCLGDGDCGKGEKCCSNGCGQVCTKISAKPTFNANCPKVQKGMMGICMWGCKTDGDCTGNNEICCSTGCGTQCTLDPTIADVPKKVGESCGPCLCPATNYDAGTCEKGLTCVSDPRLADAPGVCTRLRPTPAPKQMACDQITTKGDCNSNSWCKYKKRSGGCNWDTKACKKVGRVEADCDAIINAGGPCQKKMKNGRMKMCKKKKKRGL